MPSRGQRVSIRESTARAAELIAAKLESIVNPYMFPELSKTNTQLPSMVGGMRSGALVTIRGFPPLSTVPVDASSAQTAPPLFPGGEQQINGLRCALSVARADEAVVVPLHPLDVAVQGVPTKTTPPALAAGTERGVPDG